MVWLPIKVFEPVVANEPVSITKELVVLLVITGDPLLVITPVDIIDPEIFNDPEKKGICIEF
jgi:hypothetical protein